MSDSVTVGLDGTRESYTAADWAAREALRRNVRLRVVQVRETGAYVYSPIVDDTVEREWAQEITNATVADLSGRYPALRTQIDLEAGHPAGVLADLSAMSSVLVLGSRGLGAVHGFVVGSAALGAVAHTACPVILVRADQPGRRRWSHHEKPGATATVTDTGDVLLGVDLGQPCDELFAFAFDAAVRRSSRLRVLHGWEIPQMQGARPVPVPPGMTEEMLAERKQALAEALRPWQEKNPDVSVDAHAVFEQPAALLVGSSSEASLVVVGRRNRRSRIGAHIGPVAHSVMHHAQVPVAVVPHE